jgi:hypothetical protein
MDNTIIQQGSFLAAGTSAAPGNTVLSLRQGVDWIRVYNYTQIGTAQTVQVGVEYYWQFGMSTATAGGIAYMKSNAANALSLERWLPVGAFTVVDTTIPIVGATIAITAVTSANPSLVLTGNTAGLSAGSAVRLVNVTGGYQLGAMTFTVGAVVTNESFALAYFNGETLGFIPATNGYYEVVSYENYFAPSHNWIVNWVDNGDGVTSNITLSVNTQLQVGAQVRFTVPVAFSSVPTATNSFDLLDQVQATVTSINFATNTITVNIPVAAFGTWVFPPAASYPFSPAMVVPIGENTAVANAQVPPINSLLDATINTGAINMILQGGVSLPGGSVSGGGARDLMFWAAGKSFSSTPQNPLT